MEATAKGGCSQRQVKVVSPTTDGCPFSDLGQVNSQTENPSPHFSSALVRTVGQPADREGPAVRPPQSIRQSRPVLAKERPCQQAGPFFCIRGISVSHAGETLLAQGPFFPSPTSYSTFWPSSKAPPLTSELWTNRSLPPSSGVINPYPFVALNHFTVPLLTSATPGPFARPFYTSLFLIIKGA